MGDDICVREDLGMVDFGDTGDEGSSTCLVPLDPDFERMNWVISSEIRCQTEMTWR